MNNTTFFVLPLKYLLIVGLAISSVAFQVGPVPFHKPNNLVQLSKIVGPTYRTSLHAVNDTGTNQEDNTKDFEFKTEAASDILNSPVFLKRKLEVLKSDLTKIEDDINQAKERYEQGKVEWGSQFEDLEKEYKNIQQRLTAQSSKSDDQAVMQVARQMLDVLDNFDRAFGQVSVATPAEKDIEAEYQSVYDMILNTFKSLGVEEVESVGKEFDYQVHQAVMQKPSDDYEEGIVCEEFCKGFKIGDTLIRASMVAVAA